MHPDLGILLFLFYSLLKSATSLTCLAILLRVLHTNIYVHTSMYATYAHTHLYRYIHCIKIHIYMYVTPICTHTHLDILLPTYRWTLRSKRAYSVILLKYMIIVLLFWSCTILSAILFEWFISMKIFEFSSW